MGDRGEPLPGLTPAEYGRHAGPIAAEGRVVVALLGWSRARKKGDRTSPGLAAGVGFVEGNGLGEANLMRLSGGPASRAIGSAGLWTNIGADRAIDDTIRTSAESQPEGLLPSSLPSGFPAVLGCRHGR